MLRFLRHLRKCWSCARMIEEWEKQFPGKCIICSYWAFGRREGYTKGPTPPHQCTERRH